MPRLSILTLALTFATAAAAQQPVYQHDFDSAGGWPDSDVSGDLNAVYTVVGGEYLINPLRHLAYALAPAPVDSPSADMIVEADVRLAASQPASRAGIACRVGDDGSFYAFNLVASGSWEIVRVRGAGGEVLDSGGIGFDPAEGARLQAVCRGSSLALYANGERLGEAQDADLGDARGAGLLSVSPVVAATNAAFDNFELASLGGAPAASLRAHPGSARGHGGGAGAMPSIDDMALYADDGFGEPGARQSLFDSGRQRVYLVMDLEHPLPAHFRAEWKAIRGAQESTVLNGEYASPGRDRRVWLYAERDWSAGLYRVDVYANGRMLDSREFSVY